MNNCIINNKKYLYFCTNFQKRDRSHFPGGLILQLRTHVVWDPTTTHRFAISRGILPLNKMRMQKIAREPSIWHEK